MKDLKKMKKDELIKIIEEFRNKQYSEKEDVQKLKNEKQELEEKQQFIFERFGASDYSELLILLMDLDSVGHTVKSLIEGNDELKKEVKEKELQNEKVQKLNNEQREMIAKLKEDNGVQKLKNERGAGRKSKFTSKEIEKILKARNEHKQSIRSIARDYQCSVGLIHKLINEHSDEDK